MACKMGTKCRRNEKIKYSYSDFIVLAERKINTSKSNVCVERYYLNVSSVNELSGIRYWIPLARGRVGWWIY
jgi:hypothetical protein